MEQDNDAVDKKGFPNGLYPKGGLFWSIRTKLIVSFSLLFVVVLIIIELIDIAGVPFTPYSGRQGQQRVETFRSLNLIADLKKERLLRWIEESRDDTHVFSDNNFTVANVVQLLEALRETTTGGKGEAELWTLLQEEEAYDTLAKYLNTIITTYEVYDKIQIADAATGTIFVSTDETDLGTNIFQEDHFSGALSTGDAYVSDIKLDPQSQHPALYVSHVVEDKEGEAVAVLVMEVNTDEIIRPMLHTGEGLGEQGEALLVNQEAKILTSLKHPLTDGNTARPLEYQITAKPAVLAASGEEGIIDSEDYRDEPVLAAYRHIRLSPVWGWGMVVKRDQAELFAPLRQDVGYTVLIGLAGILALVGLTVVMANSFTRPILLLGETARKVTAGDLEARAPVTTADEVGILATTFNGMVQRIQNWHEELEEQVKTHTIELNRTNKALKAEIAERVKVEDALRAERDKAQIYLDIVGVIIVVINADQKITLVNKKGEEILGYGEEEITGKNWFDICLPERFRDEVKAVFARLMAGEIEPVEYFENPVLTRSGEERIIAWHNTILRDEAGDIIGTLSSGEDITERKRAEEEIHKLNEELEQRVIERTTQLKAANEELEAFAYSVSHDLRAPLRSIDGFSQALLEDYLDKLDAEGRDYLRRVRAASQRMAQLIDDLLKLSRVTRGEMRREMIDLSALARAIAAGQQQMQPERQVELIIRPGLVANGDARLLRVVLENLLGNAWKFTKKQTHARIEFDCTESDGKLTYFVRDNGAGFDIAYADKLFSPFQRLHTVTEFEGIGIGLATVQRIIHRHGGRVWADGAVEQGATFYFTL